MTILIVDDHSMFRNGLMRFLEVTKFKDAKILQAENGRRAIEIVLTANIDIILLDISMPEMNGYDAASRILKIRPGLKIIMLTMISEQAVMSHFFKIGVKAYLTKDANEDEIIYTMEQVLHGEDRYKTGFEKYLVIN
jgi:DNA-binding NarL/FixJ family response regulator